ncbi:endo alpha-1,4 polygalactosaminidase [Butyrivibrio sp. AE3004]|uniref:endo alpha-1,4 polygalactosaminidase n=1 Tax=Butyrivibrio sp. AE3004 TaxID=1506994 RepID=UPI00068D9E9E|nr:endo alpha-1,4 polygalactosaminidase [Butyrivibrio sp. AE3004]
MDINIRIFFKKSEVKFTWIRNGGLLVARFFLSLMIIVPMILISFPERALAKHVVDIESPDGPLGYGVYIGADSNQLHQKLDGDTSIGLAIIDAQNVSARDVAGWKAGGRRVYSYLNVGSIEEFRDYYSLFSKITLSEYENWPGEYWIDVSEESWQNYICDNIAAELVLKGVDGFFIDNCDVYYLYNHSWIYKGLVNIITRLKDTYNLPIIINGGDTFVTELMNSGNADIIVGINQESVFSRIDDYEKRIYSENTAMDRAYMEEYLARAKKEGLLVYMIEYTRDMRLVEKIKKFCLENGYKCYVTDSLELDGNVKTEMDSVE